MIITIPYEFKNGIPEVGNIYIDTTDGPYCGEKYFELRPQSVSTIDVLGTPYDCTFFNFEGNIYGVYSKTPQEFIDLSVLCFSCANSDEGFCGCEEQETTFDWDLTAHYADAYASTTIVKDVGTGNFVYTLDLTVNAVVYATGLVIWDDSDPAGPASESVRDYFDALIAAIDGLAIPEYEGAWNKAVNGAADNNEGVDMLQLFFNTGTTVNVFSISANAAPIGTVGAAVPTITYAEMEFLDTSVVGPADLITDYTWQCWDGENIMVSTDWANPTFPVWSIQSCDYLNPNNAWILSSAIVTQNGCVYNNVATAIVLASDVNDCIVNGVAKIGTGK